MSVLVGRAAPDFTANAVMADGDIKEDFNFAEHIKGKYAVLFFYPLDFTFVCPSELIAFDHRIKEFTSRGVEVIGCSIDSHFTHKAWRSTAINDGGIGEVKYPLVADLSNIYLDIFDNFQLLFKFKGCLIETDVSSLDGKPIFVQTDLKIYLAFRSSTTDYACIAGKQSEQITCEFQFHTICIRKYI